MSVKQKIQIKDRNQPQHIKYISYIKAANNIKHIKTQHRGTFEESNNGKMKQTTKSNE